MENRIKSYRYFFLSAILMLSLFSFQVNAQTALTLEQALKSALENNYSIQIVKKTTEIADNNVSIGNVGMLPKIDASARASYSESDMEMEIAQGPQTNIIEQTGSGSTNLGASIDLNWTIFDGFAMFINYNKYEELRDKSQIELQLSIEQMFKNIINAYFEGLKLQQRLEILKESMSISVERLNKLKLRNEYGDAVKVEVFKAEVDYNTDTTSYLQTKLVYENIKRNLNYLLGYDIEEEIFLDSNVYINRSIFLEDLVKHAETKNSSLNKAMKDKKISELDYDFINSMYYPRISFSTGYSYSEQQNDAGFMLSNMSTGFNIGLNASMNLWDGNKTSIQSENAKINILINDIKFQDIKKQLDLNMINAFKQFEQNKTIFDIEIQNLRTAQANFDRSMELYNLGQLTSIDFRNAQINLMMAKNRILDTKYAVKVAESELLILSGQLLDMYAN